MPQVRACCPCGPHAPQAVAGGRRRGVNPAAVERAAHRVEPPLHLGVKGAVPRERLRIEVRRARPRPREGRGRRRGRGGVGQAGAVAQPFRAWIDDWRMESLGDAFSPLRLRAGGRGFSYDLGLRAEGPEVLQGRAGYSVKSERGQASYYYSAPFLRASGEIRLGRERVEVSGPAWLDREWSSQPLEADQPGWDWFSVHLEGGDKLMLYRMRRGGALSRFPHP